MTSQSFWRALLALGVVAIATTATALLIQHRIVSRHLDRHEDGAAELHTKIVTVMNTELSQDRQTLLAMSNNLQTGLVEYNRRLERLRSDLGLAATHIISDPALVEIERTANVQDIWLVTDELLAELGGEKDPLFDFMDVMRANLARGVKYTYILPDRVHLQTRAESIRAHFSEFLDTRLNFALLAEDLWSKLPVSQGEYLVYGPHRGRESQVYYQIPVERRPRVRQWVRVSPDLHDFWIGQTALVLNQASRPNLSGR
ncbi:hypothetical protein QEZ54_19775 [Catellatospora sp. KI3]|uniref:hypothetical protein n=1 Tax=Catellatospora sp. KI3 TaxID=3041620 RepID=UPI00248242D4|nr:hypothetical protein [Catellatospora sp. KI3]MDI1463224.1 hypothetical protein [Catellatospora sp. KI3]